MSDVLEEMYHADQDRRNMFSEYDVEKMSLLREIDAQKYLLSVAQRYKIPVEEQIVTQKNLEYYQTRLDELRKGRE